MSGGVEFPIYRRQMARAAKELCYSKEIIDRVKAAQTVEEIGRIMRCARHGKITDELKMGNVVSKEEISSKDKIDKRARKLSRDDARYIKEHFIKRDKEFGVEALAKKFNVTKMCIYHVIWGRTWADA